MKERPILFSAPMVRSILDGRKTQTRRIGKPVRHPDLGNLYNIGALVLEQEPQHVVDRACPYGQPGDRLWVRETFFDTEPYSAFQLFSDRKNRYAYRADGEQIGCHRWRPSIHMPRVASRITLEITAVRVERLQEISEADALAEGVSFHAPVNPGRSQRMARDAYVDLWESINGAGAWATNPWVWVVEFRVVKP